MGYDAMLNPVTPGKRIFAMSALLLVPPAAEPWSVADAKAYLRVEHGDDDALIASLIAAARGHVEELTRRALLTQRWRFVLDRWPLDGRLSLPMGPLRGLIAARVFDAANNAHSIDLATFVVDTAANVIASPCWSLPLPGRFTAGIELDVELGFGANAGDVPDALRHAIRMLVAHWYENRGVVAVGAGVALLPAGVTALIAPYRMLSL
jgi:uncharacterized phiE125 gp8 family phage protein